MLHQEHHILQWLIQQSTSTQKIRAILIVFLSSTRIKLTRVQWSRTLDNKPNQLPELEGKLLDDTQQQVKTSGVFLSNTPQLANKGRNCWGLNKLQAAMSAAHTPKMFTHMNLVLCHHVVSISNNIASMTFFIQKSQQTTIQLRWTFQTYRMQKHWFFCSAQNVCFVIKWSLERTHSLLCCTMFDCCQTTLPKIKIACLVHKLGCKLLTTTHK